MYRVVRVTGPSTILVVRDNVESEVALAGIEIIDPRNATSFLSWTLGSSWVMIEDGQVYRSPDAMLINAELVKKGYARPTTALPPSSHTNAVYLGELDLGPRPATTRATTKSPAPRARAATRLPVPRRAIRSRAARAQRR